MDLRHAVLIGAVSLVAGSFVMAGCERQDERASTGAARNADNASASTGATDRNTVQTARLRAMSQLFDDAAITAKVKLALASSVGKNASEISVDTRSAVVTLTGEVNASDIRDRADQAALEIDGVKSVVDNIVVKSPTTG